MEKSRKMIQGLYEDLMEGTISRQEYDSVKEDFLAHGNTLSQEINALEERLVSVEKQYSQLRSLVQRARNLAENHTLTAELVNSLICRIEVSHDRNCHIDFVFADALKGEESHG